MWRISISNHLWIFALFNSNLWHFFSLSRAVGHLTYGSAYREQIVDKLRKAAEDCDCLQCFFLIHSMGGGKNFHLHAHKRKEGPSVTANFILFCTDWSFFYIYAQNRCILYKWNKPELLNVCSYSWHFPSSHSTAVTAAIIPLSEKLYYALAHTKTCILYKKPPIIKKTFLLYLSKCSDWILGTGSGLGTRVLSLLEEEFPEVCRIVTSVYPSAEDDVVTSPYNSVLAMRELTEHADCVLPVENQVCESVHFLFFISLWKHLNHTYLFVLPHCSSSSRWSTLWTKSNKCHTVGNLDRWSRETAPLSLDRVGSVGQRSPLMPWIT